MGNDRDGVFASPPRELMRLARRSGGSIEGTTTRYDHERGGRVLGLHVFWPGDTGYDLGGGTAEALGADIVEPVGAAVARGAIPHDPREYGRRADEVTVHITVTARLGRRRVADLYEALADAAEFYCGDLRLTATRERPADPVENGRSTDV